MTHQKWSGQSLKPEASICRLGGGGDGLWSGEQWLGACLIVGPGWNPLLVALLSRSPAGYSQSTCVASSGITFLGRRPRLPRRAFRQRSGDQLFQLRTLQLHGRRIWFCVKELGDELSSFPPSITIFRGTRFPDQKWIEHTNDWMRLGRVKRDPANGSLGTTSSIQPIPSTPLSNEK